MEKNKKTNSPKIGLHSVLDQKQKLYPKKSEKGEKLYQTSDLMGYFADPHRTHIYLSPNDQTLVE